MSNSVSVAPQGRLAGLLAGGMRTAADIALGRGERAVSQRNAIVAFAVRVASAAILLLSQIALARWMGAGEYGLYVYAWTWVLVIGGMATLGLNVAIIRLVPEHREKQDLDGLRGLLLGSRLLALVSSTMLTAAVAAVLWSMAPRLPAGHLAVIGLILVAVPAYALTDLQDGVGRGNARMVSALIAPYILRPLMILGGIALMQAAGLPLDAGGAALAAVAATWLAWAMQTLIIERDLRGLVPPGRRTYRFKSWLATSMPLALMYACDLALQNTDVLVISTLLSPTEAGIYFAAAKTMALILFVHYAVGSAWANRFAAIATRGDASAMRAAVRDAVRWTFWPSLGLGLVMLAAGKPLLGLFGPQFVEGYPVMGVLLAAFLIRAAVGPVDVLLNMTGGQAECARTLVIAALLNLALNLALVPLLGIVGAAAAVSISLVVGALMNYRVARRRLGFDIGVWAGK